MRAILTVLCILPVWAQDVQVQKEQALGASLAAEIKRYAPAVENERAQRYVARLGEAIAGQLENPRLACRFEVVQSSKREAVALPGGYVLAPDTLLREAGSEEEVVAMLAHAVAHVRLLRPATARGASIPLIFAGGPGGLHSSGGDSSFVPVAFREAQEKYEAEATEYGRQLAAKLEWKERSGAELQAVRQELPGRRAESKRPTLYRRR